MTRLDLTTEQLKSLTRDQRDDLDKINNADEDWLIAKTIALALFVLVALSMGSIFGYRLISSHVELAQAKNTKKIQIEDARGRADAASLLADAEIERAKGVAAANELIADSLTDRYIRWLYVDQLDQTEGTIIYVPTEAGLPVLEANRLAPEPSE